MQLRKPMQMWIFPLFKEKLRMRKDYRKNRQGSKKVEVRTFVRGIHTEQHPSNGRAQFLQNRYRIEVGSDLLLAGSFKSSQHEEWGYSLTALK